jgi:glycerol-3-phosphate dehydrogenase
LQLQEADEDRDEELKDLIVLLWWEKDINFSDYALGWDLITTCFWNSRNRYFWKLLWSWKTLEETLEIFKQENKIAEGYETMKWVYNLIKDKKGFKEIKRVYKKLKITVNDPETSSGWQKGNSGWQWKITRK